MTTIAIIVSFTSLLFSISAFVLGLMGFIQAKASASSTHTVQMQEAPGQPDLSQYFGQLDQENDDSFSVPNDKLEETLLKGF